jgi:hypothetical protein
VLTVEIDDAGALAIAAALSDGGIEIVRSTGAPPVTIPAEATP